MAQLDFSAFESVTSPPPTTTEEEKDVVRQPSSTLDLSGFDPVKQKESKLDLSDFEETESTSEQPQQDQPMFTMDDLNTNKNWIDNARIIYRNEEGEDAPKKTDKQLAEWLKNRHSEVGVDLTSMAWLASNADDFDPEVQKAWKDSMDMYDNTDWDTMSFFRAAKNMIQDPTMIAGTVGTLGLGGVARIAGGKTASMLGKYAIKEQLKNALMKRGLTEAAAKEAAEKGATKGLKSQVLSDARREALRKVGQRQAVTGGLAGAGYEGSADAMLQDINIDLKRQTSFDPLKWGASTLFGAVIGAGVGRGIPKFSDWKGRRKALLKNDYMQEILARESLQKVSNTTARVANKEGSDVVLQNARNAGKELEEGGEIEIDMQGARARTKEAKKGIEVSNIEPEGAAQKIIHRAKQDQLDNLSIEEIKDIYEGQGIILEQTRPGKWKGKKLFEPVKVEPTGLGPPRKFRERIVAQVKEWVSAGGGADSKAGRAKRQWGEKGVAAIRRQKDSALLSAQDGVAKRLKRLTNALKSEYGPLKTIPEDFYRAINRAWAGDADALEEVISQTGERTRKEIEGMRDDVMYYQDMLLKAEGDGHGIGAIKPESDLAAKIISSQTKDGTPSLYFTRQYEIFDNPEWGNADWQQSTEGMETMANAKNWLADTFAIDNEKFGKVLDKYKNKQPLTAKEQELYDQYAGRGGYFDQQIQDILSTNSHDDLMTAFHNIEHFGKAPLKILTKRKDIPDDIRALMGEYKDPFTNYANTMIKLYQTAETFNYEKQIADLIKRGAIEGAGTFEQMAPQGVMRKLASDIPNIAAVERPLEGSGLSRPLENFYALPEIANFIQQGNEIGRVSFKPLQIYFMMQGHTRAAKTIWSVTALARNFLGSGMMAMGAGYFRPSHIKAIMDVARGMSNWSNTELSDHVQKGIALGYLQSGTDLGAFRGALKDAGQVSFWQMDSPSQFSNKSIIDKAKRLNTKAVKLYQSMDDMWKELAFRNEKDSYRKILDERFGEGYSDQVVRRFRSGNGTEIEITRLDEFAAGKVADNMQNYAGVPKLVKGFRVLPMADFLAFTTEMLRTSKNIFMGGARDAKEGLEIMKRGERNADGSLKGRAQFLLGMKRLTAMAGAQSAAAGTAAMSIGAVGLDEKVPGMPITKEKAMRKLGPEWERNANFLYLDSPNKEGEGFKINLDYINPWAQMQQPIRGAFENIFGDETLNDTQRLERLFDESMVYPVGEAFGWSMLFKNIQELGTNSDQYGRKIWGETDTLYEKVAKGAAQFWKPYEPGIVKTGVDIVTSMNLPDRREVSGLGQAFPEIFGPSRVGVKKGRTGTKLYMTDELAGLTGLKTKHYDLKTALDFKVKDITANIKEAGQNFSDTLAQMQPQTKEDIVDAYQNSVEKQFKESQELFEIITAAKSAGMDNKAIVKSLTKGGLFKKGLNRNVILNMVKTGRFIPPPFITNDAVKLGEYIESKTGQKPPVRQSTKELQEIYELYAGAKTGER